MKTARTRLFRRLSGGGFLTRYTRACKTEPLNARVFRSGLLEIMYSLVPIREMPLCERNNDARGITRGSCARITAGRRRNGNFKISSYYLFVFLIDVDKSDSNKTSCTKRSRSEHPCPTQNKAQRLYMSATDSVSVIRVPYTYYTSYV